MAKPRLLVIDDDEDLRTQMRWALADDYDVLLAGDRAEAMERVRADAPGLVTLDLGLPPDPGGMGEGFATLSEIQAVEPSAKIVVITGRGDREHALRAVAEGAYDHFVKPIEIDELKIVLRRALRLREIERENAQLRRLAESQAFEGMLGVSPAMQRVFAAVRKVATVDAPVLVTGESGTGKELVARAVHDLSSRRAGQFVPINCGAIPGELLESELFGHEKGAFTGAHAQRRGRIESAHAGTLFLDELGELPLQLQVKMLRFLQDRRIERLGGRSPITVDARLISATNTDLEQAIAEGRFREDLFYRVGVVTIALPPLRQRGDDVLLIAEACLRRAADEAGRRLPALSKDAVQALLSHEWPGNVRELENRVRRAVVMAEGPRVTAVDLELDVATARRDLRDLRQGVERQTVREALQRNRGNVSRAAAELGISRPTLYDLMKKLRIERD